MPWEPAIPDELPSTESLGGAVRPIILVPSSDPHQALITGVRLDDDIYVSALARWENGRWRMEGTSEHRRYADAVNDVKIRGGGRWAHVVTLDESPEERTILGMYPEEIPRVVLLYVTVAAVILAGVALVMVSTPQ